MVEPPRSTLAASLSLVSTVLRKQGLSALTSVTSESMASFQFSLETLIFFFLNNSLHLNLNVILPRVVYNVTFRSIYKWWQEAQTEQTNLQLSSWASQ